MADYFVHRTDTTAPDVTVPEKRLNTTSLDVALVGKIRLEYGETLNESLLNVLENFACPELAGSNPVAPDLSETSKTQLSNPTVGQFWYNSTQENIYFWDGTEWNLIPRRDGYAANWGQVLHGQQIPRPVSAETGYVFEYNECIWSVAPAVILGKIGYLNCSSNSQGLVTMQYRYSGSTQVIDGQVNYLIIGISGSAVRGPDATPIAPSPTPTLSVTPTPVASVTPTISITPTPSVTPPVTVTPSPTPAASLTPSVTISPTVTPTPPVTATPTPTSSVTPTPAPTTTPSPTPVSYQWQSVGGWSAPETNCSQYPPSTEAELIAQAYFADNPCTAETLGSTYRMDYCDSGPTIGYVDYECVIG